MIAEVFLDSNILLYASSCAAEDREKREAAEKLILETRFALSTQVLQEYIANALRKKALGITERNIDATLEVALHCLVIPITLELVVVATRIRRRYELTQWDATIIAAAKEAGCERVYSEDFNQGQTYDGIKVVNPFV